MSTAWRRLLHHRRHHLYDDLAAYVRIQMQRIAQCQRAGEQFTC